MRQGSSELNFPKMEQDVLNSWQNNQVFHKQNEQRKEAKEFAFYDGPPFANGLPHYGHLLANTIKDTVPRYWVMKGYKVNRRFGWDCHGLPVEFEIEKKHELKGRPDILKLGIDRFNEMCRESVLHYAGEWQKTITRMGRWVDWDHQYRTMDLSFMESVWWVFGQLYKKGLVYKGFKVVPYSPRTSSVVSNFEANQNYQNVQDPSVTVKFKLKNENAWMLVWTTTPWTLPSNLAVAVGPDIDYVKVKEQDSGEVWILAKSRLEQITGGKKKKDGFSVEVISEFKGAELAGQTYEPMFDFFKDHKNAFKVLVRDFVSTEDGTGIVHQAPAYGEDDYFSCAEEGIDLVDPIDDSGAFTNQISPYQGMYFKDADKQIIKDLKEKGVLLIQDTLVHSYPFDERTDTPLMYKAVPSWYVAVEKIVPTLLKSNQSINWVPDHIKEGRMGSWLKNARDWAISRNRFWGTPLPVWVCEQNDSHIDVMSSVSDLEGKTDRKIDDIHLHKIQDLTYQCAHCQGTMKPVNLVFDCWFESGSMPYAQLHYPFEQKDRFDEIFPADFVAEGLDQTRGWFYTLNVLSNALFGKPAFKNVIVNGVILDEIGKKMSKRHRNYTPPDDLLDLYGADSVRLYMLNSQLLRAENLIFSDKGVKDITRSVLLPLCSAYTFLSTYAELEKWQPDEALFNGKSKLQSSHKLDRWIVSRLQSLVANVDEEMTMYRLYMVVPPVLSFIDDLTNWYIRLNRRRFWGQEDTPAGKKDQHEAFTTLYYVLLQFSKIFAPFAPFISEYLYQSLTEGMKSVKESVHLTTLLEFDETLADVELENRMELVRRSVNLGRSLRQQHKLKIRQVLSSMLVITPHTKDSAAVEEGVEFLRNELNVKSVSFTTEEAKHVRLYLKPNLKTLGRKLGKQLGALRKELEDMNQSHDTVASFLRRLEKDGKVSMLGHELTEADFLIDRGSLDGRLIATEKGVTVLLDTTLTPELKAEGLAREVVNRIQNLRKDSNLQISDRIVIQLDGEQELTEAVKRHQDYVLYETLGTELTCSETLGAAKFKYAQSFDIDGKGCQISLETVN